MNHDAIRPATSGQRTHSPRVLARTAGRRRRGFSTFEVVLSLGLFALVTVGLISTSLSIGASASAGEARLSILQAVDRHLDEMVTYPLAELVTGEWRAPAREGEECGAEGTAAYQKSCFKLSGRDVVISYEVTPLNGVDSTGGYEIVATASIDGAEELTRRARVRPNGPPLPPDESLIRVRVTNDDPGSRAVSLSLLTEDGSLLGAATDLGDQVLFPVSPDDCTSDAPCRLSLAGATADQEAWATNGDWVFTPATVTGGAATIVAAPGVIVDLEADIRPTGYATVELAADRTATSATSSTPPAGSVCLFVRGDFGRGPSVQRWCNTADNVDAQGRLVIDRWAAQLDLDGVDGSPAVPVEVPLPASTTAQLHLDPPGPLTCTAGDAGSFADGVYSFGVRQIPVQGLWVAGDACTSWVWGLPTELAGPDSTEAFTGVASMEITEAGAAYRLAWQDTSTKAVPATPAAPIPLWSKPRDLDWAPVDLQADDCSAWSLNCGKLTYSATAPEATAGLPLGQNCTGKPYCFSRMNAAPHVAGAAANRFDTYSIKSADLVKGVVLGDVDGDTLFYRLDSAPQPYRTFDSQVLVPGQWYPAYMVIGQPMATLYPATSPVYSGLIQITVADRDVGGAARCDTPPTKCVHLNVWNLYAGDPTDIAIFESTTSHLRVTQGEVGAVSFTLRSINLSPFNRPLAAGETIVATSSHAGGGTPVAVSTSVGSPGHSDLVVTVDASAASAGTHTVTVTSHDTALSGPKASSTFTVEVLPAASSVTVTAPDGPQTGPGDVTVTALDLIGQPVNGELVHFTVSGGGGQAEQIKVPACTTDTFGTCSSPVITALPGGLHAQAGPYTVEASVAGGTGSDDGTLTQVPGRISAAPSDAWAVAAARVGAERWALDDPAGATQVTSTLGTHLAVNSTGDQVTLGAAGVASSGTAVDLAGGTGNVCGAPGTAAPKAVGAWVNFDSFNPISPHLSEVVGLAGGGGRLSISVGRAGAPGLPQAHAVVGGVERTVAGSRSLQPGRSHFLLVNVTPTEVQLWVDGKLDGSVAATGALNAGTSLCVGELTGNGTAADARVDEVFVTSSPLGADSITELNRSGLERSGAPHLLVPQGGSASLPITLVDAAGAPLTGATVAAGNLGDGVSAPAAVVTGPGGKANLTVSALTTAPRGTPRELTLTAGGTQLQITVEVEQLPDSITAPAVTVPAGGRGILTVTVSDAAGQGVEAAPVRVSGGEELRLLRSTATDSTGSVQIPVEAGKDMAPGNHTLEVTSGDLTQQVTVTVVEGIGEVRLDPAHRTVPQGGSATVKIAAAGSVGMTATLDCSGCGLGLGAANVAYADGGFSFEVTDTGGANPLGSYLVDVVIGGFRTTLKIQVVRP